MDVKLARLSRRRTKIENVQARLKELAELGVNEILCSSRWGDLTGEEAGASMRQLAKLIPAIS